MVSPVGYFSECYHRKQTESKQSHLLIIYVRLCIITPNKQEITMTETGDIKEICHTEPTTYTQPSPPPMPVLNEGDSPSMVLGKLALAGVEPSVISSMMELRSKDDERNGRMAFNSAMAKAKKGFKPAKKSGKGHNDRPYSTLADLDEATKGALSEHGLCWYHETSNGDKGMLSVECVIAHESGHSVTNSLSSQSSQLKNGQTNDLQSMGGVTTYLKRITLGSILGIVSGDEIENDGAGGQAQELPGFPVNSHIVMKNAVEAYIRDGNLNAVHKRYAVSQEAANKIVDEAAKLQECAKEANESQ